MGAHAEQKLRFSALLCLQFCSCQPNECDTEMEKRELEAVANLHNIWSRWQSNVL